MSRKNSVLQRLQRKESNRLRSCKTLLKSFSLLLFVSCAGGPDIDLCASDGDTGMDCVNKAGDSYFLLFKDSTNYICLSPNDARKLLQYCAVKDEPDETN